MKKGNLTILLLFFLMASVNQATAQRYDVLPLFGESWDSPEEEAAYFFNVRKIALADDDEWFQAPIVKNRICLKVPPGRYEVEFTSQTMFRSTYEGESKQLSEMYFGGGSYRVVGSDRVRNTLTVEVFEGNSYSLVMSGEGETEKATVYMNEPSFYKFNRSRAKYIGPKTEGKANVKYEEVMIVIEKPVLEDYPHKVVSNR